MQQTIREAIAANLFSPAHAAIKDWDSFPWHRGRDGSYQVAKPQSSQALAIDVFGAIKASPDRDLVMTAVAERLGLAGRGPWSVCLEWDDRGVNRLREPRPSQIDAVASGRESLIFFECKFTEKDGGACSQRARLTKGNHKGLRQCNGDYALQCNPVNEKSGRCALSGKGIAYWEIIPKVFQIAADQDHRPCPFAGPWFQWMRNLALCHEVAEERGLRPAFVVTYADARGLPFAEMVRGGGWAELAGSLRPGVVEFRSVSFQEIVNEARRATRGRGVDDSTWKALGGWVSRKIDSVAAEMAARRNSADSTGSKKRGAAPQTR